MVLVQPSWLTTSLPRWSRLSRGINTENGPCLHEAGGQLEQKLERRAADCDMQLFASAKRKHDLSTQMCVLPPSTPLPPGHRSNNGHMCQNSERGKANGLELSASNCCFVFPREGSENRDGGGGGGKEKHAGSFSPLSWHLGFVEGFSPSHFPSIEKQSVRL